MKMYIVCLCAIVVCQIVSSQDTNKLVINPINQNEQDLKSKVYQYPQFVTGKAIFNNGTITEAKLNYSYLGNKIVFIDPKGDTLELAQGENFSAIVIETDTFRYYKKEFLQQMTHYPTYNLLLRRSLKYNGTEKKGAYGTYSGTISSSSYTSMVPNEGSGYTKLTPDQNNVYVFSDEYYFVKKFHQFYPATKKGANELFSKNQQQLKDFLERHSINFDKKEDLEKILELALTVAR